MKTYLALFLAAVLLLLPAGCTDAQENTGRGQPIHVGLLTDGGEVGDGSFNQEAWDCLRQMQDEIQGFQADYLIPGTDGNYAQCIERLAEQGCALIVCVDGSMAEVIARTAQGFPQVQFAVVDCDTVEGSNVAALSFAPQQAVYLAGIAAGKTSQSGRIGCVHGRLTAKTEQLLAAFMAGVKAADGDAEILRGNALADNDGGALVAQRMIANGVDVIFHADAGEVSAVVEACRQNGIWAVGAQRDYSSQAPKNVLTCAVKQVAVAVRDIVEQAAAGQFTSGVHLYDLSRGGVGLTDGLLTETVLNSVNNAKEKLLAGERTIPDTLDGLLEKEDKK